MATAERGGSAKPFEKGLSQNFKQINSPRVRSANR